MDKSEVFKNALAGLFFILGIGLIGLFIFTIGKDKGLTESKVKVDVIFNNIGGLSEGAPVRLSGVTIGNVHLIDFLKNEIKGRRVKVTLNIYEKYKEQLVYGTRYAIRTEGILGEKLIEIYAVPASGNMDFSKPIIGEDPIDVQDLASVFSHAAESFTKTANELSQVDMVELSRVMQESSEALLITAEGINSILTELEEVTKKSKRLIDRVEQKIIEGDLFKVF